MHQSVWPSRGRLPPSQPGTAHSAVQGAQKAVPVQGVCMAKRHAWESPSAFWYSYGTIGWVVLQQAGTSAGQISFTVTSLLRAANKFFATWVLRMKTDIAHRQEACCSQSQKFSSFQQSQSVYFFPPGVFIICWLPFFITHILNMHCDCNIPPAMYSTFTWLGYVNSAVNPIIYTTFNIEFRKAFMKILHC